MGLIALSENYEIDAAVMANLVFPSALTGSILEGGGQILRISAALSAITSTAVKISKIRANRSKPGLRPQHLAGLQLVTRICGGSLEGAAVGASEICLTPSTLRSGSWEADPGTAGSCCLLAQVPFLLHLEENIMQMGLTILVLS